MNSFVFLLIRNAKNNLLELRRKPAKLALWAVLIVGLGGVFFLSLSTPRGQVDTLDLVWLKGILFLLILFFLVTSIKKGLDGGDVIFGMNDVNLLFVSPVSPRLILVYGIARMAKTAFLASFFILFQSFILTSNFGVGLDAVFLILLGFVLAVSVLQILSLLIYSLTNGKPRRKLTVRVLAIAFFLPFIVYAGVQFVETYDLIVALGNTLYSPVADWTPIAGWASAGVLSLISGDLGEGLLFLGLLVLAGLLLIIYVAFSNPDYYEDVLVASETAFEKKRVLTEGQINPEASLGKNVRIAKTGISGWRGSTIFYKHLRESFRANLFGLWGVSSIAMVLGAALFSFLQRGGDTGFLLLLQMLMWLQIFMIGTGRGLKELYVHYIYLIPEDSFRKIVWSNLEISFKVLVEGAAIFGIAGLIMKESFWLVIAAIVVYTLFSFLLLGINYLALRWTGADISAGLLILIYTFAVIIIMLPGLIAALVLGSMIEGAGLLVGLGVLALWELLAALGCFALSRGILHNTDMPVLKAGK